MKRRTFLRSLLGLPLVAAGAPVVLPSDPGRIALYAQAAYHEAKASPLWARYTRRATRPPRQGSATPATAGGELVSGYAPTSSPWFVQEKSRPRMCAVEAVEFLTRRIRR